MKSMTGFGATRISTSQCELECQVRAVNGRFLELKINLPHEYLPFEAELRKFVQNKIVRGTVSLYVGRRTNGKSESLDVRVNTAYGRKWMEGYKLLARELKLKGETDLNFIARLPDVIQIAETKDVSAAEKKSLFKLVQDALQACDETRVREGAALSRECLSQLKALKTWIDQLQSWREEADQSVRANFREKLVRLGFDEKINSDRMAHEIALLIDKADIQEELVRLREHVTNITQLVKGPESSGKKLDFYVQELLREINTIGSKTSVSKMTAAVVDSKTLIEKLREQVQNIE